MMSAVRPRSGTLPLVLAVPILALLLNLPFSGIGAVTLTILVGTPAVTFIGTIGAALMVALRRGGLLISIMVLPFAVPVLIFGVSADVAAITGPAPFLPPFLILMALTLITGVIAPIAGAAAIRAAQE